MTFVPHTPAQRAAMLATIGVARFEELLGGIPPELLLGRPLKVPPAQGEVELAQAAAAVLGENRFILPNRVFAGGGVYPHHVPAVVDELSHRGEFYSAYTPYQPEVSQGMLQCIYEYQSYICLLSGMDISNASGYDAGTTLADAVMMAKTQFKDKRRRVLFAPHVNPQMREVAATYNLGMELSFEDCPATADGRCDSAALAGLLGADVAAVVFAMPDCLGYVDENLAQLIAQVQAAGALAIVSYYPFLAGLLKTPGELGADIVCGDAQCLGNPMGFGGPLLGFLACREKLLRVLPGRLIGRTVCERDGAPGEGFVMTLQAREQHIRRDKATSNICTNQALMALRSCIYLGAIGREGLRQLSGLCHENACHAHDRLLSIAGVADFYPGRSFFNEFTVRFPVGKRDEIYDTAIAAGMLAGIKPGGRPSLAAEGSQAGTPALQDCLTFAFTEIHHVQDVAELVRLVREVMQ